MLVFNYHFKFKEAYCFFFAERLNLKTASEYKYLSQSDCLAIDGVDEAQKFHILMVRKQISVTKTSHTVIITLLFIILFDDFSLVYQFTRKH